MPVTDNSLTNDIISTLIREVAIPEALMAVRWLVQSRGGDASKLPTDAEVMALLPQDVGRVKTVGQAFLDATRGQ